MLALAQEARDDAGDVAPMLERRACRLAHQAEAAAAIDEADAQSGENAAERARSLGESRVVARAGAAIDADILDRAGWSVFHEPHVAGAFASVKQAACGEKRAGNLTINGAQSRTATI